MDREIKNTEINKARIQTALKIIAILAVLALTYYFLRDFLTTKGKKSEFYIAQVERGDIINTLTASGIVVPSIEREVNAPVSTEIKTVYLTSGDVVKAGDVILELDKEYTQLAYDQLYDELQVKAK